MQSGTVETKSSFKFQFYYSNTASILGNNELTLGLQPHTNRTFAINRFIQSELLLLLVVGVVVVMGFFPVFCV